MHQYLSLLNWDTPSTMFLLTRYGPSFRSTNSQGFEI